MWRTWPRGPRRGSCRCMATCYSRASRFSMVPMVMEKKTSSGWRWLGRRGLVGLGCLVLVAGACGIWWRVAARRCDQAIAAARARGERVSWREVDLGTAPPDGENAAWYVQQAGVALAAGTRPAVGTPGWAASVEKDVAANTRSLDLIRKARDYHEVCWGTKRDAYGFPVVPVITNASSLAKLLRDKAILEHRRGEDRAAVESWQDMEAESRIIGRRSFTLIQSLISLIVDGIGVDAMEQIAPEIRIGEGGVSAQEARGLIAELSEDAELREVVAQGFLSERTNGMTIYATPPTGLSGLPFRPVMLLEFRRGWDILGNIAEDTRHCQPGRTVTVDELDRLVGIIPQFTSAGNDVIACVLRRRVVALTLAVQIYHAEQGRYPASLEELVPGYLPKVLLDPRSADSRPLRYILADDGRRPLVYSCGLAQVPEAQLGKLVPKARATLSAGTKPVPPAGTEVLFVDASAWVAPGPSTRQTRDHQAEQPGQPGK
jgi:hypothetical protein